MLVNCHNCNKEFKIKPSRFKKNKTHCCSIKCGSVISSKRQTQKIETNCTVCNKKVKYKKSHFNKIKNHTCSYKCSAKLKIILYKDHGNPNSLKLDKYDMFFWSRVKTCELRASKKGLECNIDYLYLKELFEKQDKKCYYSNIDLRIEGKKDYDTASVDRINSDLGYTKDNIVWCINSINIMKSNHTMEVFNAIVDGLLNNRVCTQ